MVKFLASWPVGITELPKEDALRHP